MHTMKLFSGKAFAATAFAGALLFGAAAHAQTAAVPPASRTTLDLSLPKTISAQDATFSSSSADNEVPATELASNIHANLPGINAFQYGSRRSGRPRYRGGNRLGDGTNRWGFFVGGGFTSPITDDSNYLRTSWAVGGGVTRNFSSKFATDLQFDYDNFGQSLNSLNAYVRSYTGDSTYGAADYGIDGSTHIWSFTVNPRYTFAQTERTGLYFVMGTGFYHKETTFTYPTTGTYCDYYGYCYQYAANATIQNYTSNSIGASGGFGITYKLSRFSGTRLFAEGRVVHTFNQFKPGADGRTSSDASLLANATANRFPQNSQETTYIPVKFGIRF